jgi:hypothetical protein
MTLSISQNANPNYLAKVVRISNLRKHSNADRLQVTTIDGNNVITGLDAKEGSFYVYFPLESAINKEYLSWSNSFEDKLLNKDTEVKGFFNHHGRVRAIRLRGERSEGYIVPISSINNWLNAAVIEEVHENVEFDSINEICICKKYINSEALKKLNRAEQKQNKKVAKESKIIENQFRFHIDTNHLGKYSYMINPDDYINITNKLHGTSFIVSKVLCKKKLNLIEKTLKFLGVAIVDSHYDLVYSSRKVIKNSILEDTNKNHYYGYDLWGEIAKELNEYLTEGLTIYGEAVGFTKDGGYIQKGYDYGCEPNKFKIYIYRLTLTNYSGKVFEFSTQQVKNFCTKYGLNYVPEYYYGKARDLFPEINLDEHWNENFVQKLSDVYLEKDCDLCVNEVPAEGICVRREVSDIDVYKHKSFRFKQHETNLLDSGELDLETIESVAEE